MPVFQGLVNEEGLQALVTYIKSLPAAAESAPASAAPPSGAAAPAEKGR
jgi:hypothetical protein